MSRPLKTTLGDLVEFQRGYDLPKSSFIEGDVPVISSNGILGYHNEHKVIGPGITIGRSGTVGLPHYIESDFFPHNTSLFVKDFKGNYPKYIYYLLKTFGLQKRSSGSGVPTMNRNHLHPLKVLAHLDLPTQHKIAAVLSALDLKIDKNDLINTELEAMAKTLYDYWFVQFDFPNMNGKPYKSSGGKMVWNEDIKRDIPDDWEVRTLLDIADYANGLPCQKYRPINENVLRVIKIREMHDGFSSETELVRADIPRKAIIENGDVLFSWSASLEVQIWSRGEGALNQHIFKVTSNKYPKSFYYYQLVNYLQHFKMMAENRKTTMGHITQEHLQQSRIVLPPKQLTMQLEEIIAPLFAVMLNNEAENQSLSELRDWLLPMLMNGQVAVN